MVHLAALAISIKETTLQRGADVDAERIQCALKLFVFIPDFSRVSTTQRTMVLGETVSPRVTYLTKKEELSFSLNTDILPKYKLISQTTHKDLYVGYSGNSKGCWRNAGIADVSNLNIYKILQYFSIYAESILRDCNG